MREVLLKVNKHAQRVEAKVREILDKSALSYDIDMITLLLHRMQEGQNNVDEIKHHLDNLGKVFHEAEEKACDILRHEELTTEAHQEGENELVEATCAAA